MMSVLRILLIGFFVINTLADESFINNDYDNEYSETTYLRSILNAVLNLNNPFQGWHTTENEAYEDVDEDFGDDGRYSRTLNIGTRRVCEIVRTHVTAGEPNDGYTYRPSFYYEESCKPAIHTFEFEGEYHGRNRKMCYPTAGGCRNITHELILFRRAVGSTCWEPKPTPINMGCECNFPRKKLNSISYVPQK